VTVHLERQAFVPLIAATNGLGEHTFEVLDAVDGETATLIVEPPPGHAIPAPRMLALVLNDTLNLQVLLEAAP
jgi:hypothetical protein